MENNYTYSLRKQWNDTCLSAGIDSMSVDTCARIMAVLMVYGNNEAMVYNGHFRADVEYIQKRYGINGGETPSAEFAKHFQKYAKECEECSKVHSEDSKEEYSIECKPKWAVELFRRMYGMKI